MAFLKMIGENIRHIRKAKGLTQEELSDRTGLSPSYVSDVERGERNISLQSLEKIIYALDVIPSELFNFKDIDYEDGIDDKRMMIETIRSLLIDRKVDEVRFIHRVAKEFVITVDNKK